MRRAMRFRLATPLRYRCRGELQWHEAVTENISCTGVLFRADKPLEPNTPIALWFAVPSMLAGQTTVEVTCDAFIVRRSNLQDASSCELGAAIVNYHLPLETKQSERGEAVPVIEVDRRNNLVHQLNGQLAVILGTSDLLLTQPGIDETTRRGLEQIRASSLKAANMIREQNPILRSVN